jgi:hypothetical protein
VQGLEEVGVGQAPWGSPGPGAPEVCGVPLYLVSILWTCPLRRTGSQANPWCPCLLPELDCLGTSLKDSGGGQGGI